MSCRRTAGIVAATLDERQLSDADRGHVATCRHCTAALERLPDFEGAVGRAVRSLVAEAEQSAVPEVAPPPAARGGRPPASPRLISSLVAGVALVAVAVGAIFLVTRPGSEPGAIATLPVVESAAVAALSEINVECREVVLDPAALPAVQGQSCLREPGGFQQGMALDQLTVELRRGATGIARATVAIRPMEFEGSQGPGASPTPTPIPLEPQPALGRVTAVADALFEPAHAAEVRSALSTMIDATGRACACERQISAGRIRLDGDQYEGYVFGIAAAGEPLPPATPRP
jgi:hypothetical protein